MTFAICSIYMNVTELVLGTVFLETGIIKTNYTVFTKNFFVDDDSILASAIYQSER